MLKISFKGGAVCFSRICGTVQMFSDNPDIFMTVFVSNVSPGAYGCAVFPANYFLSGFVSGSRNEQVNPQMAKTLKIENIIA